MKSHKLNSFFFSCILILFFQYNVETAFSETSKAYDSFFSERQINRLGASDAKGNLNIWFGDVLSVPLPGDVEIPLRFNFNSDQMNPSSGLLGLGWWVPLLECSIVSVEESFVEVTMLGGGKRFLSRHSANGLRSDDGEWVGEIEREKVVVKSVDGLIEMTFIGGRITSVAVADAKLTWRYQDDIPIGIDLDGDSFLTVSKTEQKIEISIRDRGDVVIGMGKHPLLGEIGDGFRVIGMAESASDFGYFGDGLEFGEESFDISFNFHDNRMEGRVDSAIDYGGGEIVKWDPSNGAIASDGFGIYSFEFVDGSRFPKIVRSNNDGTQEFYQWDWKSLVETRSKADGTRVRKKFVGSQGGSFMDWREIEDVFPDGESFSRKRSFDETGRVVRVLENDVVTKINVFEKNEFSRILAEGKADPNVLYSLFDEEGRVLTTLFGGTLSEFNYTDSQNSKIPKGGYRVVSTGPFGSFERIFDRKGSLSKFSKIRGREN